MTTRPLTSDRELAIRSRVGVGAYVRGLRDDLGLGQGEFAALVGLSGDVISKIENGVCNLPSQRALDFARTLGIDPQDFALTLFSFHDPHLFRLVFPNAVIDPLKVPEEDMRRAVAILERKARQKRERVSRSA